VKEVKDARKLLDFAISEGCDVKDWIIEEINKAEGLVLSTNPPSWEDRTAFEKAHRELVKFLNPVTVGALRISFFPGWAVPLIGLGVFLAMIFITWSLGTELGWINIGLFVTVSFLFTLVVWFIDLFTGVVSKKRMVQIIIFSYLFTLFALFGSVLVFFGLPFASGLDDVMVKSPIGIVKGCGKESKTESRWISEEIECSKARKKASRTASQWVVNIGGTIHEPNQGAAEIHGGLIVPLYVVILSLIGGAVSMTRRVPEYQKRVYLPENDENHITRERARELLVFQTLQVISAPLIAVTAYYLIKPSTQAVSVGLGFASGFASETILQAIKALVTKLTPAEPAAKQRPEEVSLALRVHSPSSPTVLDKTKGATLPISIETTPAGEAVECKTEGDSDGKITQVKAGEFIYERGSAPAATVTLTFALIKDPDVTGRLEVKAT
jgi:hypothetical protein